MDLFNKIKNLLFNFGRTGYLFFTGEEKVISSDELNQGLAFACADVIASKVATADFYLIDKKGQKVEKHEFLDLIKKPVSYLTTYDFLYLATYHILLKGRAVFKIYRGENTKKVINLIPYTNLLSQVIVENGKIKYIFFGERKETLPEEDVLDIRKVNPFNYLQGVSVFENARLEIETDIIATNSYKKLNEKGALPSGIIESQVELSEEEARRIEDRVQKKMTGFQNFFKPLILGKNLQYKTIAFSPKDLAFIDVRSFTRDQILGIFKVPKAVLFATDVNRANSEAAKYWFVENTVKPYIDLIKDKLENDLFYKEFDREMNYKLGYDIEVPEDKNYDLERDDKLVNKIYTINEIRKERGLKPIENGDYLYLDGMPIGTYKEEDNKTIVKAFISKKEREFEQRKQQFTDKKITKLKNEIIITQDAFLRNFFNKKTKSSLLTNKFLVEFKTNLEDLEKDVYEILIKFFNDELYNEVLGNLTTITKRFSQVNINRDFVLNYLKQRTINVSNGFTDTIYNDAVNLITNILKENEEFALDEIVKRLREELNFDTEWRAERLARSEIVNAYNELEKQIIREVDFVKSYKWITAKDDRVCSICQSLNGNILPKNQDFITGEHEIAHPNCRCTIVPIFI